RMVALKMLLPGGPAAQEMLARFRNETEALARLHHPNIVPIYDVGECGGRPYFTMEYVAGPSLAALLNGRPQDSGASAGLVEVLPRAIHAVHQSGLIHRDLKPGNILLANDESMTKAQAPMPGGKTAAGSHSSFAIRPSSFGIPKVTDFGLARDQAAGSRLTRSGVAMGTPCYMAPEQAQGRGRAVGPAADIYALGAILYEMLTGRPPFDAET